MQTGAARAKFACQVMGVCRGRGAGGWPQEEKVAELAGQEINRAELEAVRNLKKEALEALEKYALDFYRKVEEEEKQKREELEKEAAYSEVAGYMFLSGVWQSVGVLVHSTEMHRRRC